MSTPNPATAQRLALAVLLSLPISLFAQSGPTTVRRDVHHDVSLPLSEMMKHAPPPSLQHRPVELDLAAADLEVRPLVELLRGGAHDRVEALRHAGAKLR